MRKLSRILSISASAIGLSFVTALAPLSATAASMFKADLKTLNADFGSTASGTALLTLDEPSEFERTIRVQIDAAGLQDLTAFGGFHVAHVHGQFAGNATKPLFEQGNGDFFQGAGGTSVPSVLPTVAKDDADGDGFLNFIEGRPAYGPVVLNLTSAQQPAAPSGTPPLSQFLAGVGAGTIDPTAVFPQGNTFTLDTTYRFNLNNEDEARQFTNLSPLTNREIVLHGLTVPASISDPIDAAVTAAGSGAPLGIPLGDGTVFRITAPVAAGTIVAVEDGAASVPEPGTTGALIVGAAGGALLLRRQRNWVANS